MRFPIFVFLIHIFFFPTESGHAMLKCCFNGKFVSEPFPKKIYRGTYLPDKYIPLEPPFKWIDSDDHAYHVAILDLASNMVRPIVSGPPAHKRIKINIHDPKLIPTMNAEDLANHPVNIPYYDHPSNLNPTPWRTRMWTRSGHLTKNYKLK